jgi:hypothetical protein
MLPAFDGVDGQVGLLAHRQGKHTPPQLFYDILLNRQLHHPDMAQGSDSSEAAGMDLTVWPAAAKSEYRYEWEILFELLQL